MRSLRPDAKFGRRRKRQIPRLAGRLWATAAAPRRVSTTTQTRASRRNPADTCRSARAHRAPARRPAPRAGTRPRRAGPRPRPAGTRAASRARRARLPAAAAAASRARAPAPAARAPAAPRRGAGPARQTRLAMSGGPAARRLTTKPPRSPCASERPSLARWRESGKVYMVGREGAGPERQQRPAGLAAASHAACAWQSSTRPHRQLCAFVRICPLCPEARARRNIRERPANGSDRGCKTTHRLCWQPRSLMDSQAQVGAIGRVVTCRAWRAWSLRLFLIVSHSSPPGFSCCTTVCACPAPQCQASEPGASAPPKTLAHSCAPCSARLFSRDRDPLCCRHMLAVRNYVIQHSSPTRHNTAVASHVCPYRRAWTDTGWQRLPMLLMVQARQSCT